MKKIKLEDLKFLYLPVLILSLITLLFIISFKFFTGRLSEEQTKLTQTVEEQTVLTKKLSALQHIGNVVNEVQNMSSALPGDNPAFIEVSQIKRYVLGLGLKLNSIQIGQETTENSGITHATMNFDLEGNPIVMLSLIEKLKNAAPLTLANNIDINEKAGMTLSTFTLSTYWATFPERLPALGEPVTELSSGDGEILSRISTLDMPFLGFQTTAPQQGSNKTNPFGF